MNESTYPKLKYQGVEIKPGQSHVENPGYIYQKVASAEQEDALEGDWYDTPREAAASKNPAGKQQKSDTAEAQGRERGVPPAPEAAAGGAPAMPAGHKAGAAETVAKKDAGGEHSRHTEDWPTESDKKRK